MAETSTSSIAKERRKMKSRENQVKTENEGARDIEFHRHAERVHRSLSQDERDVLRIALNARLVDAIYRHGESPYPRALEDYISRARETLSTCKRAMR